MVRKTLSRLQAYNVMYKFLDKYYKKTGIDELGFILGCLVFLSDGNTADPATWYTWQQVIPKTEQAITVRRAFCLMIVFFKEYFSSFSSNYLEEVIGKPLLIDNNKKINPDIWALWLDAVEIVLKDKPETKPYLELKN